LGGEGTKIGHPKQKLEPKVLETEKKGNQKVKLAVPGQGRTGKGGVKADRLVATTCGPWRHKRGVNRSKKGAKTWRDVGGGAESTSFGRQEGRKRPQS